MNIIQKSSPNQGQRPEGTVIDCIVLHADAGATEQGTIAWLLNRESNVSYHYLIGRKGAVYQFVPDERKAWHAGVSEFMGRPFCNNYSIGVSFANNQKGESFPALQIDAGVALVADLCKLHSIPVDRITTHSAVSPGRKRDPGPLFPLSAFRARVEAAVNG